MYSETIIITNSTGLHARPASEFMKKAKEYESTIEINFNHKKVNAKSIVSILSAGIIQGSEITIMASGEDEKEAVKALVDLLNSGFGE